MKKVRLIRVIVLSAAAAAAVLATASCANPVLTALNAMTARTFGLVATWGNDSYSTSGYLAKAYRVTFRDDGTMTTRDLGGASNNPGTYTIASMTQSGDTRTYQIHSVCGYAYYLLVKVTSSTLEIQADSYAYPAAVNPADIYNYGTYSLK